MGGLFVVALLTLALTRVLPAAARALRARPPDGDRPAAVLALAIRGLPAERADWGRAMLGELDDAQGTAARWRFCLGCAKAAAALRVRATLGGSHRDGAALRTVVLGSAAAALALAAYGVVHYPGLGASDGALAGIPMLLAVLLSYVVCALGLSRGMAPRAAIARRYGLLGGVATGAAWLVAIFPTAPLKAWVVVPLAIAVLGPVCVGALAARATADAKAATAAAAWCGLVGGLAVFVIWLTATYLHDGGPFDPQLVRDFHASGATDLAAYAVADNLGAALGLLVVIPTVALAAGSLGARAAAGDRR